MLDPSQEMKSYRNALTRNKGGQEKASRRLSAGLAAVSPEKGKNSKRRAASGSCSHKKSPKKKLADIRRRRLSDDPETSDSDAGEADNLGRRLSDMTVDCTSDDAKETEAENKGPRPIFKMNALNDVKERMHRLHSEHEKEELRRALHKQLDALMEE